MNVAEVQVKRAAAHLYLIAFSPPNRSFYVRFGGTDRGLRNRMFRQDRFSLRHSDILCEDKSGKTHSVDVQDTF